ncbi:MAG TPA: hypothetical protein VGK74_28920 [Symbiobacteriaceae bacterium]|jgi:hypothetical protein
MSNIHLGSLFTAALVGSAAILASMYILLPALGLPKLDFTGVTGGWVGANGRYSKLIGAAVFVAGGVAWAFLYARLWPWHSVPGAIGFVAIPFAFSCLTVLPSLNQFHVMVTPMPGFVWLKLGGPPSMIANTVEHLIFALCLGFLYR